MNEKKMEVDSGDRRTEEEKRSLPVRKVEGYLALTRA